MLGEKRGESLFFQTEKAAEPKPVVMELQMVERGVQAVESHQPDHNRISATGTLNHPQKENKRPGMPTDRKDDGMEVQEEEWEEDITVGFVPGNGGPRNQDLFFLPGKDENSLRCCRRYRNTCPVSMPLC